MNLRYLTLLFCLSASGADAFSLRPSLTSSSSPQHVSGRHLDQNQHLSLAFGKATKAASVTTQLYDARDPNNNSMKSANPDGLNVSTERTTAEIVSSIKDSVIGAPGEFGTRGEAYFVAQAVLILSIFNGEIPFIGDFVTFLLGPCLVLVGTALIALGVKDLGSNISPWPQTPENSSLVTQGIYGELRHPMYAGLLFSCFGVSMWTGSAMRLVLCLGLWLLLDKKTMFEEEALIDKFQDEYLDYMVDVAGKFVPAVVEEAMPWGENRKA